MLKKALSHPPSPRRAETRPFPIFVLASLKGLTYCPWVKSLSRQARGLARFAASLAAAALEGLFEHPVSLLLFLTSSYQIFPGAERFSTSC
jgi:hypothetical protein